MSDSFHQLSYYTLSHPDPAFFIHQLAVDAYTAQTADAQTKPISLVFALVGLYLVVERGFTGRAVQEAHMRLSKQPKVFPEIDLPKERGAVTVEDVLLAWEGKDEMIKRWCAEVWEAYEANRQRIIGYCAERL